MLLLLSCFSHVRLCATPWTAAHQAPLSTGFSRQEYRSGLPFPSPMHESEKWKWSRSDPQWPHELQPSRLLHPWDFPGKSTGAGCHCLLRICFLKELQYKARFFQPPGVESQIPKEKGLLSVWGLHSYLQPPCDFYYHQPTQADFLKHILWVRQRWRSGKEFARRCRGRRFNP